jgi:hypothetical protein
VMLAAFEAIALTLAGWLIVRESGHPERGV